MVALEVATLDALVIDLKGQAVEPLPVLSLPLVPSTTKVPAAGGGQTQLPALLQINPPEQCVLSPTPQHLVAAQLLLQQGAPPEQSVSVWQLPMMQAPATQMLPAP